nr:MAG TPA: hypothetical protein [Caudoviricetes sp.]
MAVLAWNYGKFETAESEGGEPKAASPWTKIDVPKKDSLKVDPKEGETKEALDEQGNIVDSKTTPATYEITWEMFVKKGVEPPFDGEDGVIAGEHAFRFTPDDPACKGWRVDRATVSAAISFSTSEGTLYKYKAKVLKPKAGKAFKLEVIS